MKISIRKVGGQWYAFQGTGKHKSGAGLYCAIGFCKRLNIAEARGKTR